MTSPSAPTPKPKSTYYFVDKGSGSNRCLSSIGTIFRKLKRHNDPDGGETPICKKKLFGVETVKGRDEGGNHCGNEGGSDVVAKMTLSASILNSFATVGDEGIDGNAKLSEDSTGTLVLNESFFNDFSTGTLQLDEDFDADFDAVESTGSSSSPSRNRISASSSTAVIKD